MKPYRKLLLPLLLLGIALLCTSCFSLLPPLEPLSPDDTREVFHYRITSPPFSYIPAPGISEDPDSIEDLRIYIRGKAILVSTVRENLPLYKGALDLLVRTNCYRGEEKSLATHQQPSPLLTYLFENEIRFSPIPLDNFVALQKEDDVICIHFLKKDNDTPSLEFFLLPDGILLYQSPENGYYASTTSVDVMQVNRIINWK